MVLKKIEGNSHQRKKAIQRFKNRTPMPGMVDKKQLDIIVIDAALKSLYNDGDKVTRSLTEDILKPCKINITEKDAGRIWDIMVNTGLVNSVIGFGNAGKLSLTNEGYQLMTQFGSYSAFLEEKNKQSQQGQNMMFPQFIIESADDKEEKKEGEEEEKKAVGRKGDHHK
jgi:hypothetical protein